jgi:hypothetical protein
MMQFAQYMASTYGSNLKELIYTPLGFSIKNGQRVAPYAQGSHYNHVHVAYAMGAGMPAFFQEQKDAVSWEKKHLGPGVKSITTNSAEMGGYVSPSGMQSGTGSGSLAAAPININAPITINQQPGQDADQLASIVALKIGEAVADARAATIFV